MGEKLESVARERCGTPYGYQLHVKNGEKTCDSCKAAKQIQNNQWRKKNPEKVKAHLDTWRRNHPENYRAIQRRAVTKRRAVAANVLSEPYTTEQVLEKWGSICHICNREIDTDAPRGLGVTGWEHSLHLDHVVPLARGGNDTLDNVKPAHGLCNVRKTAT